MGEKIRTKHSTIRISPKFDSELEDIKDKRLESGMDKKRISGIKLTSMIPRHKHWERIKREIIEYNFRKEVNFKDEG